MNEGEKIMNEWRLITDTEPALGQIVETKIDGDGRGERNIQMLKRTGINGRLWFYPDDSMYVYYRPTHYRVK